MKKKIQTWLCFMLAFCGQASAQQITAENRPLTEVLQQVQQQTKYRFYWIEFSYQNTVNCVYGNGNFFILTIFIANWQIHNLNIVFQCRTFIRRIAIVWIRNNIDFV